MPIEWEFRGSVLAVTVIGVVRTPEIERTMLGEALLDPRAGSGTRVLWDARRETTPLSPDHLEWSWSIMSSLAQRGVLSRFALLLRVQQQDSIALARSEMPKVVHPLQFEVFSDEEQALAWLHR